MRLLNVLTRIFPFIQLFCKIPTAQRKKKPVELEIEKLKQQLEKAEASVKILTKEQGILQKELAKSQKDVIERDSRIFKQSTLFDELKKSLHNKEKTFQCCADKLQTTLSTLELEKCNSKTLELENVRLRQSTEEKKLIHQKLKITKKENEILWNKVRTLENHLKSNAKHFQQQTAFALQTMVEDQKVIISMKKEIDSLKQRLDQERTCHLKEAQKNKMNNAQEQVETPSLPKSLTIQVTPKIPEQTPARRSLLRIPSDESKKIDVGFNYVQLPVSSLSGYKNVSKKLYMANPVGFKIPAKTSGFMEKLDETSGAGSVSPSRSLQINSSTSSRVSPPNSCRSDSLRNKSLTPKSEALRGDGDLLSLPLYKVDLNPDAPIFTPFA